MSPLRHLDKDNWAGAVSRSDKPVLVDFRAPWCDPVLFRDGELEEFLGEWKDFVQAGVVDALKSVGLVARFHLQEFPTLALFQAGHWVKAFGGPSRVEDLREWLLTPEALDEETRGRGISPVGHP